MRNNMSFFDIIQQYKLEGINSALASTSTDRVKSALDSDIPDSDDFLALLSPAAYPCFEEIADKAHRITLQNFGRTIQLYTPFYISDFCDNGCLYCGYNINNKTPRKRLTLDEVEKEARYIADTGLRHILILTGDSRAMSPVSYIKDCIGVLKKYFSLIAIEVYPLSESEYKELIAEGVESLTIYQETYNRDVYKTVHPQGPKKDYVFRLNAPERALSQNIRAVNIGALLGLDDFRVEGFFTGLHAYYLQEMFPFAEISVSVPRIQQAAADYTPAFDIKDKGIAQLVCALRIFLPRIGINLSTRENPDFRDNMLALGVTKISAQSITSVGGRLFQGEGRLEQFSISDKRSVKDIINLLQRKGYQPVFKDWMHI
jgi:2-iminoacetate synthase